MVLKTATVGIYTRKNNWKPGKLGKLLYIFVPNRHGQPLLGSNRIFERQQYNRFLCIQAPISHLSLLIRDQFYLHLTSSFAAHRPARCPSEFTILSHITHTHTQKKNVSNNHMHVYIYVPSYQRPHVQGQTRLGLVWWGYRR